MTLNLVAVLREFEITQAPAVGNDVFFAKAYDPDQDVSTTFVRRFGPPDTQYRSNILMDDTRDIGSGEDPRPFFWRGSVCLSAPTFSPDHGFINKIYIKARDNWVVLIPPEKIVPGKNWVPFVRDDDLYFIHAFSPFRVLKARSLSEQDDFMVLDVVAEHEVPTPKSADNFSRLRGGANAVQIGRRIVGLGHTNDRMDKTHGSTIHRPFVFIYDPDVQLDYYAVDFDFPPTYRIVDPTSLYLQGDTLYLVTCETEKVWQIAPQKGRSCLYTVDLEGFHDEDSIGFGGRRLHRWSHGQPSKIRRLLGPWR